MHGLTARMDKEWIEHMRYGAAYYPEHWPEERWATDARLMHEAGFDVARLGEFAWRRMEPQPDRFDFTWLDRAIAVLNAEGIGVLLGTPTAGPPMWLVVPRSGRPDCRQVYEDGRRWEAGGRSLCCVNHPYFIERSERIAAALGARYANHPGVIGFQIDNELGMYGTRCYCEVCLVGFRAWLRDKYGSVGEINRRLGLVFGGNEFLDVDDVPIPRRGQDLHNPGLLLDSQRYFSDVNVRYLRAQERALRGAGARQAITTNVCHMFGGGDAIDGRALFETLDVVGWDLYPSQFDADPNPATMALLHAVARGYKEQGARYWMLEQQSGSPMGEAADDPRRSRLWAWQSVAHGAGLILYFRWRTGRFGGEQYWRGILDHDGEPNARYDIVARMGAEVGRLAPLLDGLRHDNDVAILLDADANVSLDFSAPGAGLRYRAQAEVFYAAAQKIGRAVDVVYDGSDLGRYRLVVAPLLRLMDEPLAEALGTFVRGGGALIATMLTATLDRDHVAPPVRPPYLLRDLFGVERIEWGSLNGVGAPPKELMGKDAAAWAELRRDVGTTTVQAYPDGGLAGVYAASIWYDHLQSIGAETLAVFGEGSPVSDAPAVTMHAAGAGRAVYVASAMDQRLYDDLLALFLGDEPCPMRAGDDDARVEVVPVRHGMDGTEQGYVVLNHDATPHTVMVARPFHDALSDTVVEESFDVPGYDVAILTETRT